MSKEIYTPMEQILIKGALITQEIVEGALKTKEDLIKALLLDVMLCEAEEKMGLIDGIPLENITSI